MIKSMTGYGRAKQFLSGREITIELKSVNNRHLDCSVKMPRIYLMAEDAVKSGVQASISRGKVDVYVNILNTDGAEIEILLNKPVVEGYLAAMKAMSDEYGLYNDITTSNLGRYSDVFIIKKAEEDLDTVSADIVTVLTVALSEFDSMRTREGASLETDITGRLFTIEQLIGEIETRNPEIVTEYRERLTAKMQETLQGVNIEESRILTEAAIYADKIAVDEETVRLKSHIDQMRSMLNTGGVTGRKLDFLLQEMNREANTIGSKGNDVRIARYVVDLKSELEKIREQVQNIE